MKNKDKIMLILRLPQSIIYRLIYKKPIVYSEIETVELIKQKKLSVCRFGDGELDLMLNIDINFQNNSKKLQQRLIEVAKNDDERILVCIPNVFFSKKEINIRFIKRFIKFWKKHLLFTAGFWNKHFERRKHGSAFISRFYINYKDKSNIAKYVSELKQCWDKRDIVFVEGEGTKLATTNDLFDNANSIKRIICPTKNAFNKYEEILATIFNNVDKNSLIIAALGPTATVLCYDLAKAGYQALDLGHVDIEYEWFLQKADKRVPIAGKAVNEVNDGYLNINDLKIDELQVIARILN